MSGALQWNLTAGGSGSPRHIIEIVPPPTRVVTPRGSTNIPSPHIGKAVQDANNSGHKSPTEDFSYSPLEEGWIRLVHLLPSSTTWDIQGSLEYRCITSDSTHVSQPYKALSYCWGDASFTTSITLNGRRFPVTTNLWHALSAILQSHDISLPFWIDAICINQSDIHERNHQVKRMWQIYSEAEEVCAWLGASDQDTDLAWSTMQRLAKGCHSSMTEGGDCNKPSRGHKKVARSAIEATYRLCAREYFTRTWTIVEVMNARRISLLCGKFTIGAKDFLHAAAALVDQGAAKDISLPAEHHPIWRSRTARTKEVMIPASTFTANHARTYFYEIFSIFTNSQCSDPRDRVFAMLGSASLRNSRYSLDTLGPDYRWTIDELILIVLEFYSELVMAAAAEQGDGMDVDAKDSMILLELLSISFGIPRTSAGFIGWFRAHREWMESWMADQTITIGMGRIVKCSGPVWAVLLDKNSPPGVIGLELFPGHRVNITAGFL